MLFSVSRLKKYWNIKPTGVLHVGAHEAEEAPDYEKENWFPVIWVEGQVDLVKRLKARLDPSRHTVIQAFVWDKSGEILTFKQTNNSQSSSLLDFGSHATDYPNVRVQDEYKVITSRLDTALPTLGEFDFINLDLQGVELQALVGLGGRIDKAKWIYTEVNKKQVYKNCTLVTDLDQYLKQHQFRRVATRWVRGKGWGDALYVHRKVGIPQKYKLQRFYMQLDWEMVSTYSLVKNSVWKSLVALRVINAK
jgi:FkbM family methyltransferase